MPLLHLLFSGLVGALLFHATVVLFLFLLQFLPFLFLLGEKLILLLLIFPVAAGIPAVPRSSTLHLWQLVGMDGAATRPVPFARQSRRSTIGGRIVRRTRLLCVHDG